jgi:hypothetical protein
MANLVYTSFKRDTLNDDVNLLTDTIKVMLVTSSYTPSASHSDRSDITNEVSGPGYTAGGETLTTKSVSISGTEARFFADNVTWEEATITARGAVIYKSRGGSAADDELVGYVDFVTDQESTNGDFTINWNASGVLRLI